MSGTNIQFKHTQVQGRAVSEQCIAALELLKEAGAHTNYSLFIRYCYGN